MTVKELKDKLNSLPDDVKISLNVVVNFNGQVGIINRDIKYINLKSKEDRVVLSGDGEITIFY